jgi:hypothetical protein
LCREVAAHGGVGGNVLLAEEGDEIVVVQRHRPAGLIAVLYGELRSAFAIALCGGLHRFAP